MSGHCLGSTSHADSVNNDLGSTEVMQNINEMFVCLFVCTRKFQNSGHCNIYVLLAMLHCSFAFICLFIFSRTNPQRYGCSFANATLLIASWTLSWFNSFSYPPEIKQLGIWHVLPTAQQWHRQTCHTGARFGICTSFSCPGVLIIQFWHQRTSFPPCTYRFSISFRQVTVICYYGSCFHLNKLFQTIFFFKSFLCMELVHKTSLLI